MKTNWSIRFAAAALMLGVAVPVHSQGKSVEKKAEKPVVVKQAKPKVVTTTSKGDVVVDKKTDKAVNKAVRKRVTTSQAVVVTREVLLSNGYQIVNVVPTGTTQVIYYRRGNRGNGRGLGPVEKIVVAPYNDVVRFTSVPETLLSTIMRRLGM
jgi:hypothetical protein